MSDYIDREKFIKLLVNRDLREISTKTIGECLDKAEVADVVEVVRCKGCRHFQRNVLRKVNGVPIIVGHEMCDFWGDGCKTNENDYCSYGERKDGESE